jgi:integrase
MGVGASLVKKRVRNGRTRWVIDFWYTNKHGGRLRFVREAELHTKDGAEKEALQRYERAVLTGSPDVEKIEVVSLGTFYEETFKPKIMPLYRKNTRTRYEALWRQRVSPLASKNLLEFTEESYRELGRSIERERRQAKGAVALLRTILREAQRAGIIKVAPMVPPGVIKEPKKLPDAPTLDVVEKLIANADGWLKTALGLAVYAGLRSGEIRALQVGDIDLKEGLLRVSRTLSEDEEETPKGEKERCVPIVEQLKPILVEAMEGKKPRERILQTRNGTSPKRQHPLLALVALQKKLGMERHWSMHALRHAFCSHLIRVGTGVEAVRALAGHGSIRVTNRYVHANAADLRQAMQRGFGSRLVTRTEPASENPDFLGVFG